MAGEREVSVCCSNRTKRSIFGQSLFSYQRLAQIYLRFPRTIVTDSYCLCTKRQTDLSPGLPGGFVQKFTKICQKVNVSNFFCRSNNFVPLREHIFLDDSLEVNKQLKLIIKVLIIYYNE